MLKKISCFAVIIITAFFIFFVLVKDRIKEEDDILLTEARGVFISYIEYMKYFQDKNEEDIKKEIKKMIETSQKYKFNCIYLQVRPFSDSIYYSNIFPFSHTITGVQGKKLSFDILEYFIKEAHKANIEIHAWINPYRISNQTDTTFLSPNNPAYPWLFTNHVKIIEKKGIYYNPANEEVRALIVEGIEEIVENYEVDGILLDDYFYPDNTIDLEDYKKVENTISLTDFRLSQVNELVSNIYQAIKKKKKDVVFGVSPDGNIENNYEIHYADVKKWLKEDGYIDYIMPQVYYGFLHDKKPFIQTVNEWKNLIQNDTKLRIALSIYKAGEIDKYAGNAKNEWIESNNIIEKQIKVIRNLSNYDGFSIFRYGYFLNEGKNQNLQKEIIHYTDLVCEV